MKTQADYDKLYAQIVRMYRKQRAFDGARMQLTLWRLSRAVSKGAK